VTRLQDKCPECGKVAVEKFAFETVDKQGNLVKLITLDCFHIIKRIIPKGTPFETMVSNFWKPEIAACKHDWPTREEAKTNHIPSNQCRKCGEFKLYDFQVVGARACEAALAMQKGFGIFDDMGLGKTMQALAYLKFHAKKHKKTMVVTKSAIKFQWFKAAVTWLGPEFISQIISTSKDYLMPNLKLYIIPYDLLRRFPREKLHKLGIELVILDEVQQIKNPDSSRTQEVRKLVSANADCKVIELSGTPWKNRGSEFFPALNLIDPIKFYSYQNYLDTWVDFYWEGSKKKMGGIRRPEKFKEYVSSLLIRREYNEVMDEFPDINRMKLNVQLDELEQSSYDDSVSDFVAWYNEYVMSGEEDKISSIEILAKMSRMRHITGLAKIPATLSFIEQFIEDTDRKLVVFVHHKDVGELMLSALTNTDKGSNPDWYELAQTLKDEKVSVFQYTSKHTGKPEGYQTQETFNTTKRCIMIASTLACGEGLNLQTCADSILHERQWNPQNEDQATPGRFRRIGQVSNVINITCPEAEGTIDQHIGGLVETKRRNFHAAMNKGEAQPVWNEGAFAKELAEMIVQKHREKKVKKGVTVTTNITAVASF
jgi:non-specific serine/threonine protein kinase